MVSVEPLIVAASRTKLSARAVKVITPPANVHVPVELLRNVELAPIGQFVRELSSTS
jgi:hypothetical protein